MGVLLGRLCDLLLLVLLYLIDAGLSKKVSKWGNPVSYTHLTLPTSDLVGGDCKSEAARRNLYNMDAVFVSAGIF